MKGLILGSYECQSTLEHILTKKATLFDTENKGVLLKALKEAEFEPKLGNVVPFFGLISDYKWVFVTGLGDPSASYSDMERINLRMENIRLAIAHALRVSKSTKVTEIEIDDCDEPKCVGEVCALFNRTVKQWAKENQKKTEVKHTLYKMDSASSSLYEEGTILGKAQGYAADLSETPANLKKPCTLVESIKNNMPSDVRCEIRNKEWITEQKMELFLSVNQGSKEPPALLEAHYKGCDSPPIILVGKGITFDSGGISIKPSQSMGDMKADMQGAACVFATIKAISQLKLPIHVIGIAPFTENMPSGSATRPGDVYKSMNGLTVEIDNTDAEGRLVLADAITYAHSFSPCRIIDIATLTGAICVALGSAACAIYSTNNELVSDFSNASATCGDKIWRMPLFSEYSTMVGSDVADLVNSTKKREAGSCTAASFLKKFVKIQDWAHLDIAGVSKNDSSGGLTYLQTGMSGRPTRTLIEYLKIQASKPEKSSK